MDVFQGIVFMVGEWIFNNISVEGVISLPALMVGFLVAIAIYNFEDSKKGLQIDAPTVISQVVKVSSVLTAIFLVSFPVIFWPSSINTNTIYAIPFLLLGYLGGLALLTRSLQRAFNWARSIETGRTGNFRANARAKYMESLADNEKPDAWEKIWQADDGARKLIEERRLIKLFITSVTSIKNKGLSAPWLVQDFISTIDTIDLADPVIMEELVYFCMDGSYGFKEDDTIEQRKKTDELHYSMNLRRLYFTILKKTLERNDNSFFTLIDASRKYLKRHGFDEEQFVKTFAPNFFEYVKGHSGEYWIWETLPGDWKITLENLESPDNQRVALAWLNAYGRWMSGRQMFSSDGGKFDQELDDVTRHMLPKADVITWAKLYGFHWSSYGVENGESSEHAQVRNYLENHLTFGLMSHVIAYFFGDEEQAETSMNNTTEEVLEIATQTTIFPWFHDDEAMKKFFKAINELRAEHKNDADEITKLSWLEHTLKDIQKRIKKRRNVNK